MHQGRARLAAEDFLRQFDGADFFFFKSTTSTVGMTLTLLRLSDDDQTICSTGNGASNKQQIFFRPGFNHLQPLSRDPLGPHVTGQAFSPSTHEKDRNWRRSNREHDETWTREIQDRQRNDAASRPPGIPFPWRSPITSTQSPFLNMLTVTDCPDRHLAILLETHATTAGRRLIFFK